MAPGAGPAGAPGAAPAGGYPLTGVAYPGVAPDGTALQMEAEPAEGHTGFVARLDLGPTFTRLAGKSGTESIEVSGLGVGMQLALGWVVTPGLGLFANVVGASAVNPQIKRYGVTAKTKETFATLHGFGPGLAYTFADLGLTLSGSFLLSRHAETVLSGSRRTTSSALGLGGDFGLSRTFRLSPTWGLGVGAHVQYARIQDDGATWNDLAFRLGMAVSFD